MSEAPASQELQFHELGDLVPKMSDKEFDELADDIKANGLGHPIILYEGKILDGWHRYMACLAAGVAPRTVDGDKYFGIEDPAAYVISVNIRRRHLTPEQKRDVIARLLKEKPEASDRQIAKQVRADHKTVAAVRQEKETTGEIPQLKKRTGADGKARKQPAKAVGAHHKTVARDLAVANATAQTDDFLDDHGHFAAIDLEADIACRIRGLLFRARESTLAAENELAAFNDLVCTRETREAVMEAAEALTALLQEMNRRAPVEDGSVSKLQPGIAAPSPEPALDVDPWDGLDIPDWLRRAPKAAADPDDQQKNAKAKA